MQTTMNQHVGWVSPSGRNPTNKTRDQNSHILTGLIAAQRCFDWLEAEGFTVMGLDVGAHARPLILIQACAKCTWLARTCNAFPYKLFPVQGSRATMMRADIMGCRVEWVERGQ